MQVIEMVLTEYLQRYEDEAMDIIESQKCESCHSRIDSCFPCEVVLHLLPEVEEILAAKEAICN